MIFPQSLRSVLSVDSSWLDAISTHLWRGQSFGNGYEYPFSECFETSVDEFVIEFRVFSESGLPGLRGRAD